MAAASLHLMLHCHKCHDYHHFTPLLARIGKVISFHLISCTLSSHG